MLPGGQVEAVLYAKAKVDEGKPRTIPGTYSTTAWEAAAKYTYFKAFWEGPLPE